jgi:hypothetical protein
VHISPIDCWRNHWCLLRVPDALCSTTFAPFVQNLSEYGFVVQNFWNNANQHVVPDPFGNVK